MTELDDALQSLIGKTVEEIHHTTTDGKATTTGTIAIRFADGTQAVILGMLPRGFPGDIPPLEVQIREAPPARRFT
jgi:hypothetical protein